MELFDIDTLKISQRRSIVSNLAKSLGGEWTYERTSGSWWCSDGRHVHRCCAGVDEFDNDVGPPQYWLYEDGKSPQRAEEFIWRSKE